MQKHDGEMKRYFSSHLSAGLLTAALASLLFYRLEWLAFPLVGLTCGIAERRLRLAVSGLAASAVSCFAGFLSIAAVRINYEGPPPPWPDFDSHWRAYAVTLFVALLGASPPLWRFRLILAAIAGSAVSIAVLVCLGTLLRFMLPPRLFVLEKWEFTVLLLSAPIVGAGTWGPVQLVAAMTKKASRDAEPRNERPGTV